MEKNSYGVGRLPRLSKKRQREKDIESGLYCCNPFRKRCCRNADIEVFIFYKGEKLPICHSCWKKISKTEQGWKSNDG